MSQFGTSALHDRGLTCSLRRRHACTNRNASLMPIGQLLPQVHAILSTISCESLAHVYLEYEPYFRIHLVFTKLSSDLASSKRLFEFLANSDILSRIDELTCRLVNLKVDTPSSDISLKLTSLGSIRQQLVTLQGAKSTGKS